MANKHLLENEGGDPDDTTILDILKMSFGEAGIEFESATFLRWHIVDDHVFPRPINTLPDLFREFRDGTYQLAINNAEISVSGKKSFKIPWINIEITYRDGQWSEPRIYHDDETYDPANHETAQTLSARLQIVKQNIWKALQWTATMFAIAEAIRRLFLGG